MTAAGQLSGEPALSLDVTISGWSDLTPKQAYHILQLRSQVFVVEQDCVFLDSDGADLDPETEHYFLADDAGVASYLRLLPRGAPDGPASTAEGRSLGRVATRSGVRGRKLSGHLLAAVLDRHGQSLLTLNAQERLEPWYNGFGFVGSGPVFLEDGIRHVPMRRPAER